MATRRKLPIRFEGPPDVLKATVDLRVSSSDLLPAEIEVDGARFPLVIRTEAGHRFSLSFVLPAVWPPGTVEAIVHLGRRVYPAVVAVAEKPAIRVDPKTLNLEGAPGSRITVTVQATNTGNTDLPLSRRQQLSLWKAGALARGVKKAFKETHDGLVQRLIVLGEHLSTEPAGELAVTTKAEFSTLPPGVTRPVEIRLQVPEALETPSAWTGSLVLLGASISIRLDIHGNRRPRMSARRSVRKGAQP